MSNLNLSNVLYLTSFVTLIQASVIMPNIPSLPINNRVSLGPLPCYGRTCLFV